MFSSTRSNEDYSEGEDLFDDNIFMQDMMSEDEDFEQNSFIASQEEESKSDIGEISVNENYEDTEVYNNNLKSNFVSFFIKNYREDLKKMAIENKESLYVSYKILEKTPVLLNLILNHPEEVLKTANLALHRAVSIKFPKYGFIMKKVFIRLIDLPVLESIRNLKSNHFNKIVYINGIVVRKSVIIPQLSVVKFICQKNQCELGPFLADDDNFKPVCCSRCNSKGPFILKKEETIYKDYQKITIQELPNKIPQGSMPRSKTIIATNDIIDTNKPGDEIEVVGIYKNFYTFHKKTKEPIFYTGIEAITIINKDFSKNIKLTKDEIEEIKRISHDNPIDKIVDSIAPNIFGHRDVKKAIACALFGGTQKVNNDHVVRGDINVLMLGDPGVAKSALMRFCHKVCGKSVLTNGQGASGVGLTAAVVRDPISHEFVLEGGAMVLANNGLCLIDEFDKMTDKDRVSVHEAMEQQTVSVSKAGINTSLSAKCGVIAAANPIRGIYNPIFNFNQNVYLSEPILSRFDLHCVMRDVFDAKNDEDLANYVLGNLKIKEHLDIDTFRAYLHYAKTKFNPIINRGDLQKISNLYSDLRKESNLGLPITVRQVESIIRLSESFAKMRLSNEVSTQDVNEAISLFLHFIIEAQRNSKKMYLRRKFSKYFTSSVSENLLIFLLNDLFNTKSSYSASVIIKAEDYENYLKEKGVSFNSKLYKSDKFTNAGYKLLDGDIIRE